MIYKVKVALVAAILVVATIGLGSYAIRVLRGKNAWQAERLSRCVETSGKATYPPMFPTKKLGCPSGYHYHVWDGQRYCIAADEWHSHDPRAVLRDHLSREACEAENPAWGWAWVGSIGCLGRESLEQLEEGEQERNSDGQG